MENNETKSGGIGIAIGAVIILGIVAATSLIGFGPSTTPGSGSGTAGAAPAGGIEYSLTPLRVARSSGGQIAIEAEVLRQGSWQWKSVSVQNISVTGKSGATARLISPVPKDPVPERFVLEFLCDGVDAKGSHLQFKLDIKASRHLGLSKASGQRTQSLSLESTESVP